MREDRYTELLTQEYDNSLLLGVDSIRKATTETRLELISAIQTQDIESIQDLARTVDPNNNAVMRALETLFEIDIVGFEADRNRKRPVLKHDYVFAKPLVEEFNSSSGDSGGS